jgi:hypothetical protein
MTGRQNHSTLRLRLKSRSYGKEIGSYYAKISHVFFCCKSEHVLLFSSLSQGFFATNINITRVGHYDSY